MLRKSGDSKEIKVAGAKPRRPGHQRMSSRNGVRILQYKGLSVVLWKSRNPVTGFKLETVWQSSREEKDSVGKHGSSSHGGVIRRAVKFPVQCFSYIFYKQYQKLKWEVKSTKTTLKLVAWRPGTVEPPPSRTETTLEERGQEARKRPNVNTKFAFPQERQGFRND